MTFCEHCGEPINYLPFKCKYCGGVYCKKHRLPENHQCTFELKHGPIIPLNLRESPSKRVNSHGTSKEFKKYIKRQEKQKERTIRQYKSYDTKKTKTSSITYLIIAIFIMSIATMVMGYPISLYLTLSSYSFLYLWTFITSLFVSYTSDLFGFFFLAILILFFFMMIKNIERVFGTKFLLQLYFICAFFTGLVYILLLLLLQLIYGSVIVVPYGLASGALLGVICFMIFMNWDREMTFLIFFLPIRMKGKTIIILLVLLKVVPGLLFAMGNPLYLLVYLPDLGGILASYLVHYFKFKHQ